MVELNNCFCGKTATKWLAEYIDTRVRIVFFCDSCINVSRVIDKLDDKEWTQLTAPQVIDPKQTQYTIPIDSILRTAGTTIVGTTIVGGYHNQSFSVEFVP